MILTAQDFKGFKSFPQGVVIEDYITEFERKALEIVVGHDMADDVYNEYPANPDYKALVDDAGLRDSLAEYVFYNMIWRTSFILNRSGVFRGTQDLAERTNAGQLISYHNSEFIRKANDVRDYIDAQNVAYPKPFPNADLSFDLSLISYNALGI